MQVKNGQANIYNGLTVSGSGTIGTFYGADAGASTILTIGHGANTSGNLVIDVQNNGGGNGVNIYTLRGNSSFNIGYRHGSGANGAPINIGGLSSYAYGSINFIQSGVVRASISPSGSLLLGTTSESGYKVDINSTGSASGALRVSGSTALIGSGSTILSIDGTSGRLFSVDDSLSGSLFSVNTAAGLPVMEAFSDNTVRVGQYGTLALFVSKSRVGIGKESGLNANLDVLGTAIVSGSAVGSPAFYVTNGGVQFGSTTGFVWDAANNRVGIGTNAPSYILDVNGAARIVSSLVVNTTVIWGTGTRISVDGSVGCQDLYLGYNSSLGYIYNNNGAGYNITIGRNSAGVLNYIGIAATPSTAARIQLGGTHTAVSGVSRGTFINHALTAAANNDILVGLDVGSTFTNGAFTGVANYAMRVSGSTAMVGSGSSLLTVDGVSGRLFQVDDSLSGSLFSVNNSTGLPLIEAFSDDTIRMGQFGTRTLFVSQSRVGIGKETGLNANLDVSGSVSITGSLSISGSFFLPLTGSPSPRVGSAYWSGSFLFVYDGSQYRSASFS